MDRMQRLQQETELELNRLHAKHLQEWQKVRKEVELALELATTTKEIRKIEKEYKQKFELLRNKQKEEYKKVQEDFTERLLSL